MSFKVGITSMKLTRKRSPKSRKGRTGLIRPVVMEAMSERYTKDPDYDPEKTKFNEYLNPDLTSGKEIADFIEEQADLFSEERAAKGGRRLQSTAAIGFAVIIKPDSEAINSWSEQERQRFWSDTHEIMRDFFGPKSLVGGVLQRDEYAEHEHLFGCGWTKEGKFCVDDIINPKMYRRWNHEYPAKMRARGWDIEDCEPDPNADKGKHGESAISFKRRKIREKEKELAKEQAELKREKESLSEARKQAQDDAEKIRRVGIQGIEKAREAALKSISEEREKIIAEAKAEAGKIRSKARQEGLADAQSDLLRRQSGQSFYEKVHGGVQPQAGRSAGRLDGLG